MMEIREFPMIPRFTGHPRLRVGLLTLSILLFGLLAAPCSVLPAEKPSVELYVTNWCPYCKKAISFFEDRGIEVRIFNIERDPVAAERKQSLDPRRGVPLAVINGIVVYGYAPNSYATALEE